MAEKVYGTDFTNETNPAGTETISINNGTALKDARLDDVIAKVSANATAKAFEDADQVGYHGNTAGALRSSTWASIKATLKTYLDTLYASIAKGVTNGDSHDHNGGDGAQINHTTLSNIGTNTHAQIDTFIGTTVPGTYATLAATREKLTADRTYYVRTDGNNSNTGLVNSAGGAFLTIQKALDTVVTLDFGGKNVTIQIADGTYTGTNAVAGWEGGGSLTIRGNLSTPANVLIHVTGNNCFLVHGNLPGTLIIRDMKLQTTTSGSGIYHSGVGVVTFLNINFGAIATYQLATDGQAARIICGGNYTISGATTAHMLANTGGNITVNNATVTITGTPAITFFAYATRVSSIEAQLNTYSGSATGTRYTIDTNSIIYTGGGGATYFPGNVGGSTSSGGQYL